MSDDDRWWREVDALFEAALARPRHERTAYLDRECTDPEIRRRVTALLDAEAASAPFLERKPRLGRALVEALLEEGGSDGAGGRDGDEGRPGTPGNRDAGPAGAPER